MKPLHIVFFNRAFHPETSATSQLLIELAEGLIRDHGCRVSVVAGMPTGIPPGGWSGPRAWGMIVRERYGQISILRARGTRWSKRKFLGRAANYLTYFFSACLAGLRLEKPDVVIALTDPPIIGLAAYLSSRRFHCPLVISFRDLFPEVGRLLQDFRSPWIEWLLIRTNRFLIEKADRLIALGEAMKKRLIEEKGAPAEKVCVIRDWADTQAIRPAQRNNAFSQKHQLDNRFVVMHSGNLGVSQNLEILVDAARQLKDLPDLVVLFVGDGVSKASLEARAQKHGLSNVLFLPFQPKEDLSNTFSTADCFVVCLKPGLSGYITPSKLYGILAAGRPYVASVDPECDVAQISRQFQCGLLAQPGDSKQLTDQIRRLYQDRALAQEMGIRARQASEKFDRRLGVETYYNLCTSLTSGHPDGV